MKRTRHCACDVMKQTTFFFLFLLILAARSCSSWLAPTTKKALSERATDDDDETKIRQSMDRVPCRLGPWIFPCTTLTPLFSARGLSSFPTDPLVLVHLQLLAQHLFPSPLNLIPRLVQTNNPSFRHTLFNQQRRDSRHSARHELHRFPVSLHSSSHLYLFPRFPFGFASYTTIPGDTGVLAFER